MTAEERNKVKSQILAIRSTGKFNMFETANIEYWCRKAGMTELADFIKQQPESYMNFIMTGNF